MITINSFEEFLKFEKNPGYFVVDDDVSLNFNPPWNEKSSNYFYNNQEKIYLKKDPIDLYSTHDVFIGEQGESFLWDKLNITCKNLKANSKENDIQIADVKCMNLISEGKKNYFGNVSCKNDILLIDGANLNSGSAYRVAVIEEEYGLWKIVDWENEKKLLVNEEFKNESDADEWVKENCIYMEDGNWGDYFYCENGKNIVAKNILAENDKSKVFGYEISADKINVGIAAAEIVDGKNIIAKTVVASEVTCENLKTFNVYADTLEIKEKAVCLKNLETAKELKGNVVICESITSELVEIETMYAKALECQQYKIRNSNINYICPKMNISSEEKTMNENPKEISKIKNGPALIGNQIVYIKKYSNKAEDGTDCLLTKKIIKDGRIEKLYMNVQEEEFRDLRSLEKRVMDEDKWSYLNKTYWRAIKSRKGHHLYSDEAKKIVKNEKERLQNIKLDKEL